MESSEPLSIESFSYRWLISQKPSLESLDDMAAFIDMDPKMTASKRFKGDVHDFNFDFPLSQSPITLVHADQLFSNGLLMPLFIDISKMEEYNSSDSIPTSPISSEASEFIVPTNQIHCPFLRKCRRSSKRIFQKYLGFLRPLYWKIQRPRIGTESQTSPRTSTSYSTGDWCNIESAIFEAVLYCKKSIVAVSTTNSPSRSNQRLLQLDENTLSAYHPSIANQKSNWCQPFPVREWPPCEHPILKRLLSDKNSRNRLTWPVAVASSCVIVATNRSGRHS
ncbi:hypothetical protein HHK36_001233 [Tetracentron sinense]|uniref:Membrane-associated kinase regulator 6 n=1 Tax=Tetracentron sinense TaxID=13715 RepID=A0A835A3B3_TETSI|nr:hypothetical protein HHK36_001233 [Tetracentron sinense]